MSPAKIYCPKCLATLNKPPDLEVMGDIKKAGGSGVSFADPNATLTCPKCHGLILIADIIDGKHDQPRGGWADTIITVVILLVLLAVILALTT